MSYIASSTLAALDGSYTDRSGCPKAFQQLYIARDFFLLLLLFPLMLGFSVFILLYFKIKKTNTQSCIFCLVKNTRWGYWLKKKKGKGDKIDIWRLSWEKDQRRGYVLYSGMHFVLFTVRVWSRNRLVVSNCTIYIRWLNYVLDTRFLRNPIVYTEEIAPSFL